MNYTHVVVVLVFSLVAIMKFVVIVVVYHCLTLG